MHLVNRSTILTIIQQNPGITKGQVRRKTGLSQGTVHYHMERLHRDRRISALRRNNRLHLFCGSVKPMDRKPLSVLACTYARAILRHLSNGDRARLTELTDRLDASRKVVRRCLVSMEDCGLVQRMGEYQAVYALASDAERFLPDAGSE